MTVEFRPLAGTERDRLLAALRANATDGAALYLDRRDTSFAGSGDQLPTDQAVVTAIRSIPCHYGDDRAIALALSMLRGASDYIEDARQGAPLGNSVVGSLLSTLHGIPRQYAEPAVLEALAQLDREAESAPADDGETYTVQRTGHPPLRFRGEKIAEASSHVGLNGGALENRWHDLMLYRTAGGKLVWSVAYRTRWQGEHDHHSADVTTEKSVVSDLTAEFDPLAGYAGYPADEHYAEKDRRQREAIRLGYQRAVSELLGAAGIAEEVE